MGDRRRKALSAAKTAGILRNVEAILPLTESSARRAALLLLPSLTANYESLDRLWIAAPAKQVDAVAAQIAAVAPPRTKFISDEELLPELAALTLWGLPNPGGWYRQQVIKLAISERMGGNFYLTLDDDVIAVNRFSDRDILRSDRAPRDQDRTGYRAKTVEEPDENAAWMQASAWLLDAPPLNYQPDLTPSILSRDAVQGLIDRLKGCRIPTAKRWRLAAAVARATGRVGLNGWRGRLLAHNVRWTEYTLYDTHLESSNAFFRWHYIPDDFRVLGNAYFSWTRAQFDSWRPRTHDALGRRLLFNLVQSRSGISPEEVFARVKGVASRDET